MKTFVLTATIACLVAWGSEPSHAADAWPRFRGHNGAGQAAALDIPSDFTAADYAWRVPIDGVGHSSPVVWEGRAFVTSADRATAAQRVMCFDLATGEELWRRGYESAPHAMHRTNSYATSTPAVDANHIYLAWMNGQTVTLAALTHNGAEVWKREVGHLDEAHGFGASPMIVQDTVCLPIDTDSAEHSSIVGLDRQTGHVLWRTPCGVGKTSYATPCHWTSPDGKELILMGTMGAGLTAYDPATGAIQWNVLRRDLPDRCVSSPLLAADKVFVSCGSGNNGLHLIAMQLGSASDPPQEAYRIQRNVPNIPTPVVADDLLFVWQDRGVVSCLDADTGAVHWRERVGGNFHSSPLRIGDRILAISLTGEVVVLAAKPEYELLARHSLGEPVTATPAAAAGRLLIRTEESLICVGKGP